MPDAGWQQNALHLDYQQNGSGDPQSAGRLSLMVFAACSAPARAVPETSWQREGFVLCAAPKSTAQSKPGSEWIELSCSLLSPGMCIAFQKYMQCAFLVSNLSVVCAKTEAAPAPNNWQCAEHVLVV